MSKYVRITVPRLTDLDLLKRTLVKLGFPDTEIQDVQMRKHPGLKVDKSVWGGMLPITFEFAEAQSTFECCGDEDDGPRIARWLHRENPLYSHRRFPDGLAQWYTLTAAIEALESEGLSTELRAEEGGRLRVLAA